MQDKILCCVFNHNENAGAIAWWERLSPYFDTVILDSGSEPPCRHEGALVLDNIYYSGLMNKAWELLLEKDYRWLMVVTSDLEINDEDEGVTASEKPAKTTKSTKSAKTTKSTKTKAKKGEGNRTNRAKNDLAILAEIERQAKENPNFK